MIAWLKRRWQWLVAAAFTVVGAGWIWQRRQRLSAEARLQVAALQKGIGNDKAVRDALLDRADAHTAEIMRLDRAIAAREAEIVEQHGQETKGASREEIRERLRRLGF